MKNGKENSNKMTYYNQSCTIKKVGQPNCDEKDIMGADRGQLYPKEQK